MTPGAERILRIGSSPFVKVGWRCHLGVEHRSHGIPLVETQSNLDVAMGSIARLSHQEISSPEL